MIRIIITAIFIFLLCLLTGCDKETLKIDPFFIKNVEEVVCFDNTSGKINWKCPEYEVKKQTFDPVSSSAIGLGYFDSSKKSEAFVFFKYNSSNKLLTSQRAGNFETIRRCECFKKIKGEALNIVNQHSCANKGF